MVIPGGKSLTFDALRRANTSRLPEFKNAKGDPAHSERDGSDWSLGEWMNAILGELGEAANIIKKVKREDLTLQEARDSLADELADTVTYLDILAFRAGIDLGKAVEDKWNRVSERVGSKLRLYDGRVWKVIKVTHMEVHLPGLGIHESRGESDIWIGVDSE